MVLLSRGEEIYNRTLLMITDNEELRRWLLFFLKRKYSEIWFCTPYISDINFYEDKYLSKFIERFIAAGGYIDIITQDLKRQREVLNILNNVGAKIFINTELHAKLILLKHKKRSLIVVGSANITHSGYFKNYECSIITDIEDIVYTGRKFLSLLKAKSRPYI